jgi:hypothetical protein
MGPDILRSPSEYTFGLICEEVVNLGHGTVEGNDIETVVSGIENQILAHDGQADKAKVTSSHIVSICRRFGRVRQGPRRPADIDPSEAHAGRQREV